jgi:3-oxoacyl-[acyl-carrier protein] reductase
MSRYSKIKVGDSEKITHKVTKDDISKFVELSGDDNKLHVDEEFAKKTSFKKTVAHGMIGASFISTIIGTKIPGDGALWFSQSLEFLLPVRVGDELTVSATVIKKNDRQNSIELTTDIINQNKQKVTTGVAKVKIIEDEVAPDVIDIEREKVALIIGATGGIGRQTARVLADKGFNLVLHYNSNKAGAEKLKAELEKKTNKKIYVVKADITKEVDVSEMMFDVKRYFGYITALVNASTSPFGNIKFESIEWDDILSQISINIKSSFMIMKYATELMAIHNYGKVVFITTQSTEQIQSELTHYITAKSALNGFAKSLSMDLAHKGIRVNLVSPGMTNTDLIADFPEKAKLLTSARTPLKRLAEAEDVAQAIGYLVSDASDFLTGETIRVNGGQVML